MNWRPTWPEQNPLKGVHAALLWLAPLFIMAMRAYGGTATVNYGTNGGHSTKSAHGWGHALDIHHKDMRFPWVKGSMNKEWYFALVQFAANLAKVANELLRLTNQEEVQLYIVIEPGHLHLEITLNGAAPNIKGWTAGKFFYVHSAVRAVLEAA